MYQIIAFFAPFLYILLCKGITIQDRHDVVSPIPKSRNIERHKVNYFNNTNNTNYSNNNWANLKNYNIRKTGFVLINTKNSKSSREYIGNKNNAILDNSEKNNTNNIYNRNNNRNNNRQNKRDNSIYKPSIYTSYTPKVEETLGKVTGFYRSLYSSFSPFSTQNTNENNNHTNSHTKSFSSSFSSCSPHPPFSSKNNNNHKNTTLNATNAHEIFMPALSSTMKEGRIVKWEKDIGDRIEVGDTVMVIESDKADMDVESFVEGYMALHIVPSGDSAPVGSIVALVAEDPDDLEAIAKQGLDCNKPSENGHEGTSNSYVKEQREEETDEKVPTEFISENERAQIHTGKVFMPALSSSMKEGKIALWLKHEGDYVAAGDPLVVIQTDKADVDVESTQQGYLAEILTPAGSEAPVGACLALLANSKAEIADVRATGIQCIQSGLARKDVGSSTMHNSRSSKPSAIDVFMPTLSSTMTQGKIVSWLKAVGDPVACGEAIMTIESDKADMDVESFEDGFVGSILVNEGDTADVGDVVAMIVSSYEEVDKLQQYMKNNDNIIVHEENQENNQNNQDNLNGNNQNQIYTENNKKNNKKQFSMPDFLPPSLDQGTHEAFFPGMNSEDITQESLARYMSTPEGKKYVEKLQSSQKGKEELERMLYRSTYRQIPSTNLLYANVEARDGGIWKISGYAKNLAVKGKIDLKSVRGNGPGGRIFGKDVETAIKEKASHKGLAQETWKDPIGAVSMLPSVAAYAKETKADTSKIRGTGTFNRVTREDINKHLGREEINTQTNKQNNNQDNNQNYYQNNNQNSNQNNNQNNINSVKPTKVQMTPIQKAIAKNMRDTQDIPVFRVSKDICVTQFEEIAKQLKTRGVSISVLLAKACALTLRNHPLINSYYEKEQQNEYITNRGNINISTAVATPDGLFTPTLINADIRNIFDLARNWTELVEKAKSKNLKREDYSSGSFYISNLGMYGSTHFDAILPAQTGCILAIGTTRDNFTIAKGILTTNRLMNVTATCDHRHIYGAHIASFLQELGDLIGYRSAELLV